MSGITDRPSPAPTAQDAALAERLAALAGVALSGATEQVADQLRAHSVHIALLDRQAPVIAELLSMCRASAERWQAGGYGHFSVARNLPGAPPAIASLLQSAIDGEGDSQLHGLIARICAASVEDAQRLLAIGSGVHALLDRAPPLPRNSHHRADRPAAPARPARPADPCPAGQARRQPASGNIGTAAIGENDHGRLAQ
ncbi:hypothetical protein [Streptomyces sp. PD-S100-1]|uniref:hypothetical protein n=1 Tax=Streptomyces sp. PD-S100-1 TaxID=3394351 RepID=UPI0039BC8E2B